jgi:RNA polymerase sigma-70 factor (ECF subfamily)
MQESYLAALAGADKFLKKSSGRTWMTSILKHKVYDQVRRACRDRAIFASDSSGMHDESNNLAATVADPSTELDRKELRDAIEEALSELPARLEKAFTLYESEEWSSREVCAELGISENNLWIILHRARKKLREQLSEWQTLTCSGQIALT